jgi:uncharacterized protein YndB with AHSA1/START domain
VAGEVYETELFIAAPPERVFDHFCQPDLLVRWMGDYARLDAVTGGTFSVDINGVLIRGEFVRLERPAAIEIAWGELGNEQMPPGSTRLSIALEGTDSGTTLRLRHEGLVPAETAKHAVGWPHFLARLAATAAGGDPGPDPFAKAQLTAP